MAQSIVWPAASRKPQAASRKPQAASRKPQAASRKPQAASRKPQAASRKPSGARPGTRVHAAPGALPAAIDLLPLRLRLAPRLS
ncbi:hypothetical protein [Paraburkholderia megapolitana]|uniref:hypothetical protein n=1 Tax=Paraburkholderia megapolitana TaxID=420953 RepID=UPI0038BA78C1